ncbi:hypothetical protein AN958_06355, partial [Leucoagaricus sp. SymC.cos]
LAVQIQTTDTRASFRVKVLLDSRATGLFIDSEFIWTNQINTHQLSCPIPVDIVDGTLNNRELI